MEWILILIVLYLFSHYLYRSSDFVPMKDSEVEKELAEIRERNLRHFNKMYEEPVIGTNPMSKDSTAMFMSAKDKADYLNSAQWRLRRREVFKRDNNTCQSCGRTEQLECHHIDYSMLGNEPLIHLTTLCRNCHQAIHNRLGYDRQTLYPILKESKNV